MPGAASVRSAWLVILAAASSLLVSSCAGLSGADRSQLPRELSDRTFWEIATSFSEPAGVFPSDDIVSNEIGAAPALPEIEARLPSRGSYIGVGPEQNFTYIAALQPRIAFIVDIRRGNMLLHLMYKALFELSPTRDEFLSRLFSRRPSGTPPSASAHALFDALRLAPVDTKLHESTRAAIHERLTKVHHSRVLFDDGS